MIQTDSLGGGGVTDDTGRGVIYYMKDEWNNECPYDFKNIQFARYQITDCPKVPGLVGQYSVSGINDITVDTGNPIYCYTFSSSNTQTDMTINGYTNKVYNNSMLSYVNSNVQKLNANVFFGGNNYCNVFLSNCYNNTFGNYYQYNTFGNGCHNNTFGTYCYNNTLGASCFKNTFGTSCFNNTFGNECNSNTFGTSCNSNTFGTYCYNNTLGASCFKNTFGNYCYSNAFGTSSLDNTFGNDCYNNAFGNYYQYNTFGNSCDYNTFVNDFVKQCTFFDSIMFLNISVTTSNAHYLQNMQVLNGTKGASSSNKLQITNDLITSNLSYTTVIGKNSTGTLVSKTPMD